MGVLTLASCDNGTGGRNSADFNVVVTVDSLKCDSVSLVVVEPAYHQLRSLGSHAMKRGKVTFAGQLDGPRIAMLKLNRASKPLYFILEPCSTTIYINRREIVIKGGVVNHEFLQLMKRRNTLIALDDSLRARYTRMVADTTMTRKLEAKYLHRDSVLNDSLQSMTLHLMQRNDVIGVLYRDRFSTDLDSAHLRLLLSKPKSRRP